jgi:hypothetical protein
MTSVEIERPKLDARKRLVKRLAQYMSKTAKPGPTRHCLLETYHDNTAVLPVYAHYASLKHNMLVEDDTHRTFYTSFGDDPDDNDSDGGLRGISGNGDIRDQEDIIAQNQKVWHKLNSMTERAYPYTHFVEELLAELGTDVESVIQYLVDDLKKPPTELPKDLVSVWKSRDQYLQDEGFYENDINGNRVTQKRWTTLLDRFAASGEKEERKRATAGLAFAYFSKLVGFSLWHVVRITHLTQDFSIVDSRAATTTQGTVAKLTGDRSNGSDLRTYSDLACLACKS